jgi:hypothetical protein
MALTARYLVDTSAAARLNHPMVKQLIGPMIESGVVATTAALDYEAFYSTRSSAEFGPNADFDTAAEVLDFEHRWVASP